MLRRGLLGQTHDLAQLLLECLLECLSEPARDLGMWTVIRIERTSRGEVHIIGALDGTVLTRLFELMNHREVALDLSEVSEADAVSVRLLARRVDGGCRLVNCPKWLALWIERERQTPLVDA